MFDVLAHNLFSRSSRCSIGGTELHNTDLQEATQLEPKELRTTAEGKSIASLPEKESDGSGGVSDEVTSIFKGVLSKPWFPKDVKLDVECVVPEVIKRLDENDMQTTKEILELLVAIKK